VVTRDPVVTPTRDPVVAPGGTVAPVRGGGAISAVPLTEVAGVGPTFAARLEEAGITDTGRLAAMEPARVAEVLRTSPARAEGIVSAAGERLRRG
jgi:predicted flap endonuclease-1-like 5' DNA nuclease